ncbi:MAG TPA: type I phosphomannose isomerase catalytic subunit [Candidatus Acidoferrales bacterium]|nr:type I phosphomannose isomerase catalytic subunit [Candidatus Acidoferrales bacterium]
MAETVIYPYLLDPKLTTAIWGGDELVRDYGKRGTIGEKLAESWECWDANAVLDGALQGKTVADLRAELRGRLVGDLDPSQIFPILTKIITAHDWLSVQVHPDDAYARRVEHQRNGKTECWYVFSAEPDAEIVLGWTRDTSRQEYERRVADGTLGEILRKIPVKAGDTFYIPAGEVHAIGAGIVLFETQQASDLTYRMFDWNRVGPDGKGRELHVQKAADVLDYRAGTSGALFQLPYRFEGLKRTALIGSARFVVERVIAGAEPASINLADRPAIVMTLDEPLEVCVGETAARLERYQTALVPAAARWCAVTGSSEETAFMLVTPPQGREQLAVRMLAGGAAQDDVDRFMAQF